MKNQQFAPYRAGQYASQLPAGYMAAATEPGRAIGSGIQSGLQALAAGVMRRGANQRAAADRAREEAKEAEKQAKEEGQLFDQTFNLGKSLGLWDDAAKGQSTHALLGQLMGAARKLDEENKRGMIDGRERGLDLQEEALDLKKLAQEMGFANDDARLKQGDRSLDLQERGLNAKVVAEEFARANAVAADQGITDVLALQNPEFGEIAAMNPGSAAAIAELLPSGAERFSPTADDVIDFGNGYKGIPTSNKSIQVVRTDGSGGQDTVTSQQMEDGTTVLFKNGEAWKTVNPQRMSRGEMAILQALGGGRPAGSARNAVRPTSRPAANAPSTDGAGFEYKGWTVEVEP